MTLQDRIRPLICAVAFLLVTLVPACQPTTMDLPTVRVPMPEGYSPDVLDVSPARRLDLAVLSYHSGPNESGMAEIKLKATETAAGCVMAYLDDGWVYGVTCYHCVPPKDDEAYRVVWYKVDGQEVEVVARDPTCDLAVMRFRPAPGETYTPATFATPILGERVVGAAYLNWTRHPAKPMRVDRHVLPGYITMLADNCVGISSPTRSGCSGSPVFNMRGDVVAIVSSKFIGGDSYGYAIDARMVQRILKNARE